jgi:hypothetical protein
MNPTHDLEERIKRIRVTTTDALDQRILADALAGLENTQPTPLDARRSSIWRTVMTSKWTKLAAALLIVATLSTITYLRQTANTAYALEQTREANRRLRYIHIRVEPAGQGLSEAWAQFGEEGEPRRLRMIFPNTTDGAKEVVWQQNKAEVWFKTKKVATVVHEKELLKRMPKMLQAFDPRACIEQLHEAQAKGEVSIETREPSAKGDPITLVASFNASQDKREAIYQINPRTKLVERIEMYRLADGERELVSRLEYLEYNQEVPPGTFVLDIPSDVMRVDTTTQAVGLSKGGLTDGQIAVKVAREFFEALIAKDYRRAGIACSGLPASKVKEMLGETEFLEILSVGDPTPHPDPRTEFLQVPCKVKFRVEGKTDVKTYVLCIRAIYGRPDRWGIQGGI